MTISEPGIHVTILDAVISVVAHHHVRDLPRGSLRSISKSTPLSSSSTGNTLVTSVIGVELTALLAIASPGQRAAACRAYDHL